MGEVIHQRYELLRPIGRGGTGEVFEALDLRLKRTVAIKRVRAEKKEGRTQLLLNLLREAENLARVEHPNVVTVHDIVQTPTSVSIIMELVKGTPLLKLIRHRGLSEEEFLGYFRQLVAAVEAVHSVGMIHRDINPRNVLVSREGVVKLTDFGLSGTLKDAHRRRGGTLAYMAPETLRKGAELGFGVDIYSLGFLAYQSLLGIRRFKEYYGAQRPRDWIRWVLSREPFRRLEELGADVHPALSDIVARMLEKDPRARYRRIEDVRKDLEAMLAGKGAVGTIVLSVPPERSGFLRRVWNRMTAPLRALRAGGAGKETVLAPPSSSGAGSIAGPQTAETAAPERVRNVADDRPGGAG